ncbi:hypothetical protein [Arthrobacter sp. G119Y2]|uniref:hypothetical protein n=1 Tax=Arthrobacter sp. G119Y2 TaxID=3134965 RepID=UPI00311A7328
MDDEIQLINDGDGLAVIGDPGAVDRFLSSEGLESKDLGLRKLGPTLGKAAGVAEMGSQIAANSGRWVKLTEESAQAIKKFGLMKNSQTGLSMGVVQAKGQGGGIKAIVQFSSGNASKLANPALLAGAAGIMAQAAMQQSMDEITDYLAAIDEKVDDILRAQKDAVLADMLGVDFVIEEALTVRAEVGRVSDVTWSKVQATSGTIGRTQAYALRQLEALAEKLEEKAGVGDLAKATKNAEEKVREWLAVLARCFQLQDALNILELDRVLDSTPEDLDQHRRGLKTARRHRTELIARSTGRLMARLDAAAGTANAKVLLNPTSSRAVVKSSNHAAAGIADFQGVLGIDTGREALEARLWLEAAEDVKDRVVGAGADGVDAAKRLSMEGVDAAKRMGTGTMGKAKSVSGKVASRLAERSTRWRRDAD